MATPEEVVKKMKEEQQRLLNITNSILSELDELGTSDYWSYTKEYELGKIAIAKLTMESVKEHLKPFTLKE